MFSIYSGNLRDGCARPRGSFFAFRDPECVTVVKIAATRRRYKSRRREEARLSRRAESMSTKYSLAEVARHSTRGDCWLTIHHKVYDITNFLEDHPGGEEVLLGKAGAFSDNVASRLREPHPFPGGDATLDFEDLRHTLDARARMKAFELGEIQVNRRGCPSVGLPITSPRIDRTGKEPPRSRSSCTIPSRRGTGGRALSGAARSPRLPSSRPPRSSCT